MIGKALEAFFIRIWVVIKLNLYFWLYSVAGLFVAGVGPALKAVNELFAAHEFEYKEITFKEGWQLFKVNFKRGNGFFWFYGALFAVLAYNLYLSVQIKGLAFLVIDFILLFALLYTYATYQYTLLLDSEYDISMKNVIKLAFISTLSSFTNFLKIVIGGAVILWFTWKYKGLILFGTVAAIQLWNYYSTQTWRGLIDERLETND
ncbi:hypothetical protein IGI37_003544 [Enterococcus sp. AZ194]|uniref:YesL family protein n=1 Tax=Enterococcus sp. AZ194 TaxID=2774629 RepID=UPI003F2419E9